MSFVAIKSEEQLDLQALHRARERLVSDRTRLINQGRGFLMERGIIPRQIGGYGLPHCLRFTVGLEEENRAVVAALTDFAA